MRHAPLLLGAILIFAFDLHAELNPNYSLPEVSLAPQLPTAADGSPPLTSFAFADAPVSGDPALLAAVMPDSVAASGADQQNPVDVHGVFQTYRFQIYGGYSFFRFYVASKPNLTENMNGLDFGFNYFPSERWIGVETQFAAEFGSLLQHDSKFAVALGGARARMSVPGGVEVWGHVLVGYTHFIPQTALGGQGAFAFEAGGGADLGSHRSRLRVRVEGDLVGTRYFSTYQYSPRFAVGLVYNYW